MINFILFIDVNVILQKRGPIKYVAAREMKYHFVTVIFNLGHWKTSYETCKIKKEKIFRDKH
jgi:hypothetical protein